MSPDSTEKSLFEYNAYHGLEILTFLGYEFGDKDTRIFKKMWNVFYKFYTENDSINSDHNALQASYDAWHALRFYLSDRREEKDRRDLRKNRRQKFSAIDSSGRADFVRRQGSRRVEKLRKDDFEEREEASGLLAMLREEIPLEKILENVA